MKLIAPILAALCLSINVSKCEIGNSPSPEAAWDHSSSSNFVGRYEVHYGQTARLTNDPLYERGYTSTNLVPRFFTGTILTNIHPGIWFLSVMAVTTNGIPSIYSNEVCYTNRGNAPTNLRLVSGPNQILQGSASAAGPWIDLAELTNPPVQLTAKQKQFFRLKTTNAPPLP